uniref:NF-kappa-B inhibitor-interacting Ras-like protein n=2 Tax=Acrobeloides nanus TaxID=290746 RepID=A0A914CFH0_9BILA
MFVFKMPNTPNERLIFLKEVRGAAGLDRLPSGNKPSSRRYSLTKLLCGKSSTSSAVPEPKTSDSKASSPVKESPKRSSQSLLEIPPDSRIKHIFPDDGACSEQEERVTEVAASIGQVSLLVPLTHRKLSRRQSLAVLLSSSNSNLSSISAMRKVMRVVVVGAKKVGKTAILQQLSCYKDITNQAYQPTIDDTYQIQVNPDAANDRPKEILVFHDTAGISDYGPVELRRPYIQVADAFILVYSVVDHESFNRMDLLKKFIEKQFGKDKKEVPIIVLGNMTDLTGRRVDSEFALNWASKERVKLYETTATNRDSLVEIATFLASRYFHPTKESKFSLTKKLKPEKSNTQIVMDF